MEPISMEPTSMGLISMEPTSMVLIAMGLTDMGAVAMGLIAMAVVAMDLIAMAPIPMVMASMERIAMERTSRSALPWVWLPSQALPWHALPWVVLPASDCHGLSCHCTNQKDGGSFPRHFQPALCKFFYEVFHSEQEDQGVFDLLNVPVMESPKIPGQLRVMHHPDLVNKNKRIFVDWPVRIFFFIKRDIG